MDPIAIVGIGCRFPGAGDPRAFWALLREGRSSVGAPGPERSRDGAPARPGGFLDRVDGFDWRAFRIPPREARALDPQHRLLLEVAWEALEDAGLTLGEVAGARAGVHIGIGWNDYLRMLCRDPSSLDGYAVTGNLLSFAANRVSFVFDLHGPSEAIDAACASSLMSVLAACRCLRTGESDLALAGGVHLTLGEDGGLLIERTGILSDQGRCRVLDASADGVVRGEGAGLVVLKRLSDVGPGDRVYALIRGGAASHAGRTEWIMAPSAPAQTDLIRRALGDARVTSEDVDYVELHGAATLRGDAIESAALAEALGPSPDRTLRVGSVKTNIGALEAAGGIAGLIKVALMIHHAELPPTLHLDAPNPDVDLAGLGLEPVRALEPWPERGGRRIAGVTATGLGGASAHLLLSDAPAQSPAPVRSRSPRVIAISALDRGALVARASQVAALLDAAASPEALLDLSYTLCERRTHHRHRIAAVGSRAAEIASELRALVRGETAQAAFVGEAAPSEDSPVPATPEALVALCALHVRGTPVSWTPLFEGESARVVALPTYPWQRERLWMQERAGASGVASDARAGAEVVAPGAPDSAASGAARADARRGSEAYGELLRVPAPRRRTLLVDLLRARLANTLGLDEADSIGSDQLFFELGVSSISAVALQGELSEALGMELPSTVMFDHPSLERLARYISGRIDGGEPEERAVAREPQDGDLLAHLHGLTDAEAEALLLERLGRLE